MTFAIALGVLAGGGAASASTTHDLRGTWSCCGAGGAGAQVWTITTMDKASGAFTGTGTGGSIKMTITGTATGDSVTLITDYDNSSYAATFTGTLSADSKTMSGSWESNVGQKGTWTATRPSAPAPSTPSNLPTTPGGAKPVAGELYVSDSSAIGGSAIYRVNTANGSTALVHQGSPFSSIRGIAFGPNGNLFVADFGDSTIDEVNLKTGAATRFSQPTTFLYRPWGIAYSHLLGGDSSYLFVSDGTLAGLAAVDTETGEVRRVTNGGGLSVPRGLASPILLSLFAVDFGSAGVYRIRYNQTRGWTPVVFKEGPFNQLQDIAIGLGPKGYRFFVSDSQGGVFTWEEPSTSLQPTQVVPQKLIVAPAGQSATGLALSMDGKTLYAAFAGLAGAGQVIAYDLASGRQKVLASGFQTPIGLAVAPPKVVNFQVNGGSSGTSANPSGVATKVKSAEVALFTVSVAVVNLPNGTAARASGAVQVKAVAKPVRAGKRTTIKVPFKRSLAKRIKAALKSGARVKAKVTITATATNGASRKVVKRTPITR